MNRYDASIVLARGCELALLSVQDARNPIVDVAKGIGIVLVVLGHNWFAQHDGGEVLAWLIFSFHMPLFILLSGVFLKNSGSFVDFFRGKMQGLLKPYFGAVLLMGGVAVFFGQASLANWVWSVLYGTGESMRALHETLEPLWFLPCLFISIVFSWLILRAMRRMEYASAITMWIALILLVIGTRNINTFYLGNLKGLPFSADLVPVFSAFILLGHLLRSRIEHLKFDMFAVSGAIAVFFALQIWFDVYVDLNKRYFGDLRVALLQIVLGIYITLSVSRVISETQFFGSILRYIGSASLFILIFHQPLQSFSYSAALNFIHSPKLSALISLILGVALPLYFFKVAQRWPILRALFLTSRRVEERPQKLNR